MFTWCYAKIIFCIDSSWYINAHIECLLLSAINKCKKNDTERGANVS